MGLPQQRTQYVLQVDGNLGQFGRCPNGVSTLLARTTDKRERIPFDQLLSNNSTLVEFLTRRWRQLVSVLFASACEPLRSMRPVKWVVERSGMSFSE